eukprot:TRINITY_DN14_c0_g2_i1.p1 TRINITY_DN14_c0_g2~~TRINITY_DN14_c0_g2_i1.p1  ORF type:complete len:187 (+),score=113.32 TRINITY_DN14_c0_g2_i1:57-617(+)
MTTVLFYCAIRGIATPHEMKMQAAPAKEEKPVKEEEPKVEEPKEAAPPKKEEAAAPAAEEDDDIDLFGSDDEEDEEVEAERNRRLAESQAKKKEKGVIAKSSIVLDVKPFDDETDLGELEKKIREVTMEGLDWKASKLEEIAFGIKKLVISCHVEDDKVSTDLLVEKIEEFEDEVQSVDIAAFNKL